MLYYKAKSSLCIAKYPYIIPKDSLYTEREILTYRLDEAYFQTVNISKMQTMKLYYDFRFDKRDIKEGDFLR